MGNPIFFHKDLNKKSTEVQSDKSGQPDLSDLLHRIAEQDERQAFSMFFKLYHSKLLLLARIFVSSPQEAEDVVSDVLIKLLRNRRQTFNKNNFLGFLYTCVKNQALDHIRKQKKHRNLELNQSNIDFFVQHKSNPCQQLVGKELEKIIFDCVEGLPPRRKLIYKLIKDDGLSYKEVANLLTISVRTVEVQLRFAVRKLKLTIDDYLVCNP